MKNAPSQWLQYLTALSLTLSSSAYALPSAPAAGGSPRVSQQATSQLNDMAQSQVTAPDQRLADWLQIIWIQSFDQIIIIIIDAQAEKAKANDFGSYKALLDSVKKEA